jgi:hypothetical protein
MSDLYWRMLIRVGVSITRYSSSKLGFGLKRHDGDGSVLYERREACVELGKGLHGCLHAGIVWALWE